jgi:hypothetical protein
VFYQLSHINGMPVKPSEKLCDSTECDAGQRGQNTWHQIQLHRGIGYHIEVNRPIVFQQSGKFF